MVADQPGQGAIQIDGRSWRLWDHGEDVEMTEELASMLKVAHPENERRQCVTMTMAAAVEWRKRGRRPDPKEVVRKAQELRLEQTRMAKEAEELIGNPEEMVAPIEHALRIYIHDLTTPAHEKDFRGLAVFRWKIFRRPDWWCFALTTGAVWWLRWCKVNVGNLVAGTSQL